MSRVFRITNLISNQFFFFLVPSVTVEGGVGGDDVAVVVFEWQLVQFFGVQHHIQKAIEMLAKFLQKKISVCSEIGGKKLKSDSF